MHIKLDITFCIDKLKKILNFKLYLKTIFKRFLYGIHFKQAILPRVYKQIFLFDLNKLEVLQHKM